MPGLFFKKSASLNQQKIFSSQLSTLNFTTRTFFYNNGDDNCLAAGILTPRLTMKSPSHFNTILPALFSKYQMAFFY